MANHTCVGAVQTNRLRVSRLTAGGYVDAGASNLYVTDSVIEIGSTPVYADATEVEQRNGSDVVCVSYKGADSYKRHDLTMSLCLLDAQLLEMLCGHTLIAQGGHDIGVKFTTDPNTDYVCLEAWQLVVEDGEPTGEFVHWVWPRTRWRQGQTTRNNGVLTVPLVGTGFANSNVGLGPAGDWPTPMTSPEGWFIDDDVPVSACGYATAAVGS